MVSFSAWSEKMGHGEEKDGSVSALYSDRPLYTGTCWATSTIVELTL